MYRASGRTPLSKQRNKHLQRVLVEAAKVAPRESPELALLHGRELQKGNANRATLALARKMVSYLLAVDRRGTDFISSEQTNTAGLNRRGRLPGPPDWPTGRRSLLPRLRRVVSGLAVNPNSIFCEGPQGRRQQMMSGSAKAGTIAERHNVRAGDSGLSRYGALLRSARQENRFFS